MDPLASLRDAEPAPFWLDDPAKPQAAPAPAGDLTCDLLVVGGGYTGLWTALVAKERDPSLDVVLIEADEAGGAASGRNGGFCESSLTHGLNNGLARWPGEVGLLERLGRENLQAMEDTLVRHGVDCDWERTGSLVVATHPHQVAELQEEAEAVARYGGTSVLLDTDAVRAEIDSPTFLGGLWNKDDVAMVNPARLAWGLKRSASISGSASTSTPPRCRSTSRARRSPSVPPTAGSPPARSLSPPTRTPHCFAATARTPFPSTTTRS